ncbi:DNA primase [Aquisalimonas sp. 2447]|uniref:DNA primase n=1 Tax=Aquisalimonas sp. 2447 TaxID=2740807 RepID=UPI00143244EC|nr:DNA primase [Aquisalimonas sp. 2447]QIT56895.1 DNA primase [Aquisalimonas sp. 2447]
MAGRIPDQFIDDLLARVDIVELIGSRLAIKKAGANYQALCPFHTEKTPSFTVSPSKQFYHCFGCGAHGTAVRFLMEYDRMSFPEAVEALARQVGMELPKEARAPANPEAASLYPLLDKAGNAYRQWLRQHPDRERAVAYLRRRGLSGDIAARYGIGFAPPGWDNVLRELGHEEDLIRAGLAIRKDSGSVYDRFRDRIMFPIRDRRGRVIGFGGRVLDDGEPKYLNSPETPVFHKGRELYGLHECLEAQRHPDPILVVEGYMDVVALAQQGLPNAVATLGTATTTDQVERLFRATRNVVFCFDGDQAGRQAAWRALENTLPALRDDRQARFLFLPDGEDPDSLVREQGAEAFQALVTDAESLSQFMLRELGRDADLYTVDGRARLVERGAPVIARAPQGVFRDLLVDELARHARVDRAHVERAVAGDAAPATTSHTPRRQAQPQRRTAVRVAIALLLQHPELAEKGGEPERFRDLDQPGADLLAQVLELLQEQPHLKTGAILERFRDDPFESALWKLAAWDHLVPEGGAEAEFKGAMNRLDGLLNEQRLQYLHQQWESGRMTEDEQAEWLELLRRRKGPTT